MSLERLNTFPVMCQGGLDSNKNHLALSSQTPGAATQLTNFEPSLYGGYARLKGFEALEANFSDVDDTNSEGKILGIEIYNGGIITARKTKSVSTYQFFYWTSGADWTPYTTGLTLTATSVNRIRASTFNFAGEEAIIFTDGVNGATLFDGTNWSDIAVANTGADFANAGGAMALAAPKYVTLFKNHLFVSGDATNPQIVAHSAPSAEYDWTAASGAGQIVVGFSVKQIKPYRDELYVFGDTKIKKIVVEADEFVLKDVASNIGLLASDSVVEVNGDLLFLSADGVRTISGTEKNNDVELGVINKKIQQDTLDLIESSDFNDITAVVIRKKSQVRFFFSDELLDTENNEGILGGLRGDPSSLFWEWSLIKGIRSSCATSGYIGSEEYVLHGDHNGKVYRQESGDSFDGSNITAIYRTPYFDFGDVFLRKNVHKIIVFIKADDQVVLTANITYDWGSTDVHNPSAKILESLTIGYTYNNGTSTYDDSVTRYASLPVPILIKNLEGSFYSMDITFTSNDSSPPYSIHAIVFEYAQHGRK